MEGEAGDDDGDGLLVLQRMDVVDLTRRRGMELGLRRWRDGDGDGDVRKERERERERRRKL